MLVTKRRHNHCAAIRTARHPLPLTGGAGGAAHGQKSPRAPEAEPSQCKSIKFMAAQQLIPRTTRPATAPQTHEGGGAGLLQGAEAEAAKPHRTGRRGSPSGVVRPARPHGHLRLRPPATWHLLLALCSPSPADLLAGASLARKGNGLPDLSLPCSAAATEVLLAPLEQQTKGSSAGAWSGQLVICKQTKS